MIKEVVDKEAARRSRENQARMWEKERLEREKEAERSRQRLAEKARKNG